MTADSRQYMADICICRQSFSPLSTLSSHYFFIALLYNSLVHALHKVSWSICIPLILSHQHYHAHIQQAFSMYQQNNSYPAPQIISFYILTKNTLNILRSYVMKHFLKETISTIILYFSLEVIMKRINAWRGQTPRGIRTGNTTRYWL